MIRETLQYLALDKLVCDPQVRARLNGKLVEEIAQSFKSVGQLQPVRVRLAEDRLIMIDGHHRLAAAKLAGLPEIACIIEEKSLCEGEVIQRQLIANCLRESLTPLEAGRAIPLARANKPLIESQLDTSESAEKMALSEIGIAKWIAPVSADALDLRAVAKRWGIGARGGPGRNPGDGQRGGARPG